MKPKYYKLASIVATLLVLVAETGIKPACAGYIYQPRIPKCLTEKK